METQHVPGIVDFDGFKQDLADPRIDFLEKGVRDKLVVRLLAAYLKNSVASCAYYRNLIKTNETDLSVFRTLEDFRRVPLLTPSRLDNIQPEELLPDAYLDALKKRHTLRSAPNNDTLAHKFSTSGSTGKPKVVYYTKKDWEIIQAAILRALQHVPFEDYASTFNCFNPGHVAAPVFRDALHTAGAVVVGKHFTHVEEKRVLSQLETEHAEFGGFDCLAVPPCTPPGMTQKGGTLRSLLDNDSNNVIGKRVRLIITTGAPREHPSYDFNLIDELHQLNRLAKAEFKTKFVDFAGCAEVLPTMAECQNYGTGMHLLPGAAFTEVINPDTGEHVKNGERGLLVYTGLKYGSRYIRYVVGDEATYVDEPCKCGRTTPRIRDISRVFDRKRLEGGCAGGF